MTQDETHEVNEIISLASAPPGLRAFKVTTAIYGDYEKQYRWDEPVVAVCLYRVVTLNRWRRKLEAADVSYAAPYLGYIVNDGSTCGLGPELDNGNYTVAYRMVDDPPDEEQYRDAFSNVVGSHKRMDERRAEALKQRDAAKAD